MSPHYQLLLPFFLVLSTYNQANADCVPAKLPLHNGEIRPLPFVVHIWVSRADTGEHSCIGIIKSGNKVMVPEWCVDVKGEKRGRIAIYAPKLAGEANSFSRSNSNSRYDEQFDFIYEDDDLQQLIQIPPMDDSNLWNVVILKIPTDISHLKYVCLWNFDTMFSGGKNITATVVSWTQGPNGEFFLVQKLIDDHMRRGRRSREDLKGDVEDAAEAIISVSHDNDDTWTFDGFLRIRQKYLLSEPSEP